MLAVVYVSEYKIAVPALPTEFVARPALRELLDRADQGCLVVVCAPAGYGKSSLLADWATGNQTRTAWVSVDRGDNDSRHLWAAVRAAIARTLTGPPDGGARSGSGHLGRSSVEDLLVDVAGLAAPIVLVLDDLQEIVSADVLRELTRFLAGRPATLRVVLASRVDPLFVLARLRAEGRLCEIRTEQLRFSDGEAAALLARSGCELTPGQTAELVARAEGWAAGIRLAAVALRHAPDADRFLAEFSGDERSVADYLTGEVMAGLDEASLDLLRAVSVCSTLTGALAVRLSGRADARARLDRLAVETGLVEIGPADTYRVLSLLRSYLQASLNRRTRRGHQVLHEIAARWWAGRGEAVHALRHAEQVENDALLTDLLRRFGVPMLLRGDVAALRRALAVARGRADGGDPVLFLLSALDHLWRRVPVASGVELARARRSWPAVPDGALRALLAAVELLTTAQSALPDGPPAGQDLSPAALPIAHRALLYASRGVWAMGHADGTVVARSDLEQALHLARAHDFGLLEVRCLTRLAVVAWARGDARELDECAAQAVSAAARFGHPSSWSSCAAALLAHRALLAGDPVAAAAHAGEALGHGADVEPEAALLLHAVSAAARSDTGGGAVGLAEARAARVRFDDGTWPAEWLVAAALLEHRIALLVGNPAAAAALVDWLRPRTGPVGELAVMRAMIAAAVGDPDTAAAALGPVRSGERPPLLAETAVEVEMVHAAVAAERGAPERARAHVEAAADLGRSLGVVRPLALAAPSVRPEVVRLARGSDRFAVQLAAALSAVVPTVAAALSDREAAVLALLPSLLSAREIGGELGISHNTVKTHIRSIYAKLGVSRRREAVHQAEERGLLT
ncbi:MAG: LuxR C-terminal-related transcriptional regulator [Pseudonocardia sp.]